jgi:hypothetical protein
MRRSLRKKLLGRSGLLGLLAGAALVGSALGGVAYAQTPAPDTGPGTQTQTPTPERGEAPAKPGCPEKQGSRGAGLT